MNTDDIIHIGRDQVERVRGAALPIFIHNDLYHLTTLDVYEDGVVDCWELIPITEVQSKVDKGWINTEPPEGARLSIFNLGELSAMDAQWFFPRSEISQRAEEILNRLNPERKNLLDLQARRQEIAAEDNLAPNQIALTRARGFSGTYRRIADRQEIGGTEVPVFFVQESEFQLTRCLVYQDRYAQLGYQDELLPLERIREMLDARLITTSIPNGAWVTMPGLGRFRAVKAIYHVDPYERWREILNKVEVLNGQLDSIQVCYQAYGTYQDDPNDVNLEHLRTAYEAVPKHHRIFTQQSMDDKDHTIQYILYGPLIRRIFAYLVREGVRWFKTKFTRSS